MRALAALALVAHASAQHTHGHRVKRPFHVLALPTLLSPSRGASERAATLLSRRARRRPLRRVARAMAGRPQVLRLYKQMLRSARGFDNYNFRDYTLRYVRDDFRAHRGADAAAAAELYAKGLEQHDQLKRLATVSTLYPQGKHAME